MFNPSLAAYDTSIRVQAAYSSYDCYGYFSFADLSFATPIQNTKLSISGFLQCYDYDGGVKFLKPMNALVSISRKHNLELSTKRFTFIPTIEIGVSSFALVTVSGETESIYKLEEHDECFRFSSSFAFFNNKWSLGVKYQGINRPNFRINKANQWIGGDLAFMGSFSNLFCYIGGKNDFENSTLAYFITSFDRFPYGVGAEDHYYALRRIGLSFSKSKYLIAGSVGILNNNERFIEYKFDLKYKIRRTDLGVKIIYCDDPTSRSSMLFQSGQLSFPLSNATIVNFAFTYTLGKISNNYSIWNKVLIF
jgi:hypothetical protein